MPFYPTREFILANPIRHKKMVIATVIKWRAMNKKRNYNQVKQLLHQLAKVYGVQISVCKDEKAPGPHFNSRTRMITLTNNSIISALHEFAHALYGRSESIACRWSIWLFKKTYPKEMEELVWKGHMLVRRHIDDAKKESLHPDSAQRAFGF